MKISIKIDFKDPFNIKHFRANLRKALKKWSKFYDFKYELEINDK